MEKAKWFRMDPTVKMPEWSEDGTYFSFYPPSSFKLTESDRGMIPTGLCLELPKGYQLMIRPVPKLIDYGVQVWNTVIEKFDDLYYSQGKKHQIYIGLSIDAYHSYEFWPDDAIARGVIIKTPQFEFEDVTNLQVLGEEEVQEMATKLQKELNINCVCDDDTDPLRGIDDQRELATIGNDQSQ